jgi:DNA-binding response OmpR family regulator
MDCSLAAIRKPNLPNTLSTARISVLIIEDQDDVADSLALVLENVFQYRVTVARDGEAGIRAASEVVPDAVVCDIGLPKKNGYEVAAAISRTSRKPLLIAVTGYGDDAAQELALRAGFNHYLVKPADPEEIESLIRAHWRRTGSDAGRFADDSASI